MGALLSGLGGRIAAQARRFGPLPWSVFMEAALYDPDDGFYQAGGQAGRGGDFVTSPELGPLFAAVWAQALDQCWEELGRPDPFFVVEAAAGAGTLARDILAARPACAAALRYVLVERSAALRAVQAQRLPLEHPAFVLGPVAVEPDPDFEDEAQTGPGTGPLVTALAELPAGPIIGVVVANELLDNLAFDLLEWRDSRWNEVLVAAADSSTEELDELTLLGRPDATSDATAGQVVGPAGPRAAAGELVELLVPAPPDVAAEANRLVADPASLPDGARLPLQREAATWLRQALATLEAGRVVVIDYADTTDALARRTWTDWLRTFRQHQVALFPLQSPGTQDITTVVASDQLAVVRPLDDDRSQSEWLAEHGLVALVEAAADVWRARAGVGDLAALAARSRVHEGQALADPGGLGGHRVLQWVVH